MSVERIPIVGDDRSRFAQALRGGIAEALVRHASCRVHATRKVG